uniref:Uncharacterized protein n=1 Tax=Zea mays TaxID=4577 RepID=A0A804U9C4_MAIZE
MRTSRLVFLFAIVPLLLLLASSGLTPTKASSAGCPHPRSMILYPDLPCDPDVCAKSCAKGLNNGNGTCMRPLGCDCEYCVPAATVAKRPAAVSTRLTTTTTTMASAGCPHPRSTILYPDLPCDPDVCAKSCAKGLNNGNGTCMRPIGCDCVFCVPETVAKRPAVSTRLTTTTTTMASAGCPHPRSTILYPDLPCDPDVCAKSCAKGLNNGNGTCVRPIGCDCVFCVPTAGQAARTT